METRKIIAYTKKHRDPMSLSNYMPRCGEGTLARAYALRNTINAQPMDPESICRALNNHKWTTDRFEPYRPLDNGIAIKATDCWGNEDIIEIREEAQQ